MKRDIHLAKRMYDLAAEVCFFIFDIILCPCIKHRHGSSLLVWFITLCYLYLSLVRLRLTLKCRWRWPWPKSAFYTEWTCWKTTTGTGSLSHSSSLPLPLLLLQPPLPLPHPPPLPQPPQLPQQPLPRVKKPVVLVVVKRVY